MHLDDVPILDKDDEDFSTLLSDEFFLETDPTEDDYDYFFYEDTLLFDK
jgi:hypothetical protein